MNRGAFITPATAIASLPRNSSTCLTAPSHGAFSTVYQTQQPQQRQWLSHPILPSNRSPRRASSSPPTSRQPTPVVEVAAAEVMVEAEAEAEVEEVAVVVVRPFPGTLPRWSR